jgi:hypothetical protein
MTKLSFPHKWDAAETTLEEQRTKS